MKYLILVLVLIGCTPKQRLNRLVKRHPYLIETKTDTRIDTLVIQRYDTISNTKFIYHDSTIVINNERVKLKYFYDTLLKEIYHEVECKEFYISDTNTVTISKIESNPKENNKIPIWWVVVGFGFIIILILLKR